MKDFTRAEKKELRRLSSLAHERELAKELSTLMGRFSSWQAGKVSPFELSHDIHEFHDGVNRELYKFYTMTAPQNAVARGVVEQLLSPDEIRDEMLGKLQPTISMYRELNEIREADNSGPFEDD